MRWKGFVSLCAVVCFVSIAAFAQDYRGEVHGGYSYLNIDTNGLTSRQSANGWEAGASGNFNRWFGVEFSGAGYYKTYSATVTPFPEMITASVKFRDYSYVAGPRFNFKPFFAHALLGGDHLSADVSETLLIPPASPLRLSQHFSQDGFAGAFGGGIQQKISGPLSVRVGADYIFTRHNLFSLLDLGGSAYTQHNYRIVAGIAYSFGGGRSKERAPSASRGTISTTASSAPASMSIPTLGISVVTTQDNKGAQIVQITPGGVADFGGLHRMDLITAVNGTDVHTPMELAAALNGVSGNVKLVYQFRTEAGWWIGKETTVVIGK